MAKKPVLVLDAPVQFGGVSIGDNTARLGVRFARDVLNLDAADELLCNHRLTGSAILGRNGDAHNQQLLVDDADHRVDGTFDVKGFRCTMDVIATGLTFSLADIDVAELAKLSKGEGRLLIESIGEIPVEEREKAPATIPGTLKADGPWKKVPLDELFSGAILKSLNEGGIKTVGDLADYTATENQRITDIAGIGPGKAETIDEVMLKFWAANPQARDED